MGPYFGFAMPHYITKTWADAMSIIYYLKGILVTRGIVTIADYNKVTGQESVQEDYYYGWDNLDSARVGDLGHGFAVILPPINVTTNYIEQKENN